MAINYTPVGWDTTKFVNPTNMNQMDAGIKAACDGVDSLDGEVSAVNESLAQINVGSIDGSSFSKDFLGVAPSTAGATSQKTAYFAKPVDDSAWSNIPEEMKGKLWLGTRFVMRRNSTHILVEIHEMFPEAGRVWTNFYNNGTWTGWKSNDLEDNLKYTEINVNKVAVETSLFVGTHYATLTPNYSGISGTIVGTSIVALGDDSIADETTPTLSNNTLLSSVLKGASGKIEKIGVITNGARTIRAVIGVWYV